VQMIFTTRETCPPITLNGIKISQAEDAKYLGLHLDGRLKTEKNIYLPSENNWITTEGNVPATRQ